MGGPCPTPAQGAHLQLTRLVEELAGKPRPFADRDGARKAAEVDEEEVVEALDIGQAYSTLSLSRG